MLVMSPARTAKAGRSGVSMRAYATHRVDLIAKSAPAAHTARLRRVPRRRLAAVAPVSLADVESRTMPMQTTPPNPWKYTIDLIDELDSAVRAENLAAAREVLDKYRGTIDKGLFDAFDSAVHAEDLAAVREVLDKNRAAIEAVRKELAESEGQSAT